MTENKTRPWRPAPPWSPTGYARVGGAPAKNHEYVEQRNKVEIRSQPTSRKAGFRPIAHNTWWLMALAAIVLALIGLLEYGLHVLPQQSTAMYGSQNFTDQSFQRKRDIFPGLTKDLLVRAHDNGTTITSTTAATSVQEVSEGQTRTSKVTIEEAPTSTSSPSSIVAHVTTTPSAPDPGTEKVSSAAQSEYVSGQDTTIYDTTPTAPRTTSTTSTKSAPDTSQTPTPGSTRTPTTTVAPAVGSSPTSSRTDQATSTHSTTTTSTQSSTPASAAQTIIATTSSDLPSTIASSRPSTVAGHKAPNDVTVASQIPLTLISYPGNFFIGIYGPILIAILIRLLAHYVYRSTKLVDPFVMLSRPEGATFDEFFWSDHLGNESILAPFHAAWSKRWALLTSLAVYYAAQLLAPFASELDAIYNSSYRFQTAAASGVVLGPALWIAPIVVRILQGILAFIIVQLLVLWIFIRVSNVPANPASIGVVASLLGHHSTNADFSRAAHTLNKKAISACFGAQRYNIQSYIVPETGATNHGIVQIDAHRDNVNSSSAAVRGNTTSVMSCSANDSTGAWAYIKRNDVLNLAFATASALTLFGLLLSYYLNSQDNGYERFMDAGGFGPRFVLTGLVLLIKAPMLSLCARATAAVPFERLAAQPRLADLDLLHSVPLTALGSIYYTMRRGRWYTFILNVAAGVIIEILLVLIPGVPYAAHETWTAAKISWIGCIACSALLVLMTIVSWIALILGHKSDRQDWPYAPTSVGAVAMYVAGSNMASDAATSARASFTAKGVLYQFTRQHRRWLVDYAEHATTLEQGLYSQSTATTIQERRGPEKSVEMHRKSSSSDWKSFRSQHGRITSPSLESLREYVANHHTEESNDTNEHD